MAIVIALILIVAGSVLFHLTPLASHWKTMDGMLAYGKLDRTGGER